jgi:murein DD-endopeptidase MepM/ murein hydrolase activator NlpD
MKRTLSLAAMLVCGAAQAAALTINTYPSTRFYTHPLDEQRGVRSMVLQNLAFINSSGQPMTIDSILIELLNKGEVVDSRIMGKTGIERAVKTGQAMQAGGQLKLYAFQFGQVLGEPPAALAASSTLDAGQGLLVAQQTFAFNGGRDEVRITASGTAGGQPVRAARSLPIVTAVSKNAYYFPLKGRNWYVGAGASLHTAHRWAVPEEYALDILRFGDGGKSHGAKGASKKDYYAYGAPVLAASDGKVVAVDGKYGEDETLFRMPGEAAQPYLMRIIGIQDRQMAKDAAGAAGNYVIVEHPGSEYSVYAHLRPGSVKVVPGALVTAGQQLGELGTSGMSTEPHLHFQVCDRPDPVHCAGLPVQFRHIELPYADVPRALQSGDMVNAD